MFIKYHKILLRILLILFIFLFTIFSFSDDDINWKELKDTYSSEVGKFKVITPVDESDINLKAKIQPTIVYEYTTVTLQNEIVITSHTEKVNMISSTPFLLEGVVVSDHPIIRLVLINHDKSEEIITKTRNIDNLGMKKKFIHPISNVKEGTNIVTIIAQNSNNKFMMKDITFDVLKEVKFSVKGAVKNENGIRQYSAVLTRYSELYGRIIENFVTEPELPKVHNYSFDINDDGEYQIKIKAIDYKDSVNELERDFVIDTSPPQIVIKPQRIYIKVNSPDYVIQGELYDLFGIDKVIVYDPHNSKIFSEAQTEKRSDGKIFRKARFITELKNLTPGIHQFVISAFDNNGNVHQEYLFIEYSP